MKSVLLDNAKKFAIHIVKICQVIQTERRETTIVKQLLRSGTSIGANIHEANYASSKLDFVNKLQIALKECYETEYWLELFYETEYLQKEEYQRLIAESNKIRIMLVSSIRTAKASIQ